MVKWIAVGCCVLGLSCATRSCADQAFAGQQAMVPPASMQDGRNCDAFLAAPTILSAVSSWRAMQRNREPSRGASLSFDLTESRTAHYGQSVPT
jgi:hypothetical protein